MTCEVCKRRNAAGMCSEGYIHYLSGDYPCSFNPDPLATMQNPRVIKPLPTHKPKVIEPTADGLEDLL